MTKTEAIMNTRNRLEAEGFKVSPLILYECDPMKNQQCFEGHDYIGCVDCHLTIHKEFAKTDEHGQPIIDWEATKERQEFIDNFIGRNKP